MDTIEPDVFDLVVVGSGLPESLLACAAAKGGRSVLLVDSADFYGGAWSSVSWDTFQSVLASGDAAAAPAPCAVPTAAASDEGRSCPPTAHPQPLSSPLRILSRQTLTSDHSLQHECKYFIVDLNPKVLYQGEALVNAMVKCNVHNYIEFKMIEGSVVHQQGALKPVPASKSDVFKTRDLSLLEKRSLMQLLNTIMAPAPTPHAPTAPATATNSLHDPQAPLADLLAAAKLPPRLQDAVLYGIAMGDAPQPPPPSTVSAAGAAPEAACSDSARPSAGADSSAEPAAACAAAAAGGSERAVEGAAVGPAGTGSSGADAAAAAGHAGQGAGREAGVPEDAGRAAVRLYMESLGKYGGKGAFMAPLYGCGSIVEGFIRAAAVAGAVTVLRHPLAGLELQAGGADDPAGGMCTGLLTSSGQRLQCKQLAAAASALRTMLPSPGSPPSTATPSPRWVVSRAVAVLDAPLQPGLPSTTVVFPPTDARPSPVRALQLGSHTCVTQAGRFLLYLATPAASDSAAEDLMPSLSSLASTTHLRAPGDQPPQQSGDAEASATTAGAGGAPGGSAAQQQQQEERQQHPTNTPPSSSSGSAAPATGAPTAPSSIAGEAEGAPQTSTAAAASTAGKAAGVTAAQPRPSTAQAGPRLPALPKVLHVEFYQQELLDAEALEACLPANVVCCADPDPFLVGFVAAFQRCEATFRRHFPDVRWVNDTDEAAEAQVPLDDDEALALDDLSSAVKEISAAQEAPPAQESPAAQEQAAAGALDAVGAAVSAAAPSQEDQAEGTAQVPKTTE